MTIETSETMWKDALWLTRKQWRRTKIAFVFTILFFAAYGGLAGIFLNDWLLEGDHFQAFVTDGLIATFMTCVGFMFSRGYMNNAYWKNDSFTKQIAMLRTLPIPVGTLALSRSLQIVIIAPITTLSFFGTMYAASDWIRALPLITFLQFVLVWFAFGNLCSSWLAIREWSVSGKKYLLSSAVVVATLIIVSIGIYPLTGQHVTTGLVAVLQGPFGWVWTATAIVAIPAGHLLMYRRLSRLLQSRDYA